MQEVHQGQVSHYLGRSCGCRNDSSRSEIRRAVIALVTCDTSLSALYSCVLGSRHSLQQPRCVSCVPPAHPPPRYVPLVFLPTHLAKPKLEAFFMDRFLTSSAHLCLAGSILLFLLTFLLLTLVCILGLLKTSVVNHLCMCLHSLPKQGLFELTVKLRCLFLSVITLMFGRTLHE